MPKAEASKEVWGQLPQKMLKMFHSDALKCYMYFTHSLENISLKKTNWKRSKHQEYYGIV